MKRLILLILLLSAVCLYGQTVLISGRVLNEKGLPLVGATVKVDEVKGTYYTNELGYFEIPVPPNGIYSIRITYLNHYAFKEEYVVGTSNISTGDLKMLEKSIDPIDVEFIKPPDFFDKFPQVDLKRDPTTTGNFEDFLKIAGIGISSNNELSSNYNVRGGNYDENKIFINGVIEIYRPFLVRAGQQEGMSFIHGEFVKDIFFSAGGFDANYGDVLSSVLDVRYREPVKFGGSAQASLMGGQTHVEGVYGKYRGNYIIGARYRNNSYVLGSLPTQGDYHPTFFDVQGMTNYYLDYTSPSQYKKIYFLGHYSSNNYKFIPSTRNTSWGTVNEAYQLRVYFEGQEETKFSTYTLAAGYEWKASKRMRMNFVASVFHSIESEHFDVLGEYWINQLETDPSKEEFGDSTSNVGVGGFLDHARNDLEVWIGNVYYDGHYDLNAHKNEAQNKSRFGELNWGLKAQFEHFHDVLSEWHMVDSAGYSIPGGNDTVIDLKDVIKQNNLVESYTHSGHFQFTQNFIREKEVYVDVKKRIRTDSSSRVIYYRDTLMASPSKLSVTFGTRAGYRTYNGEYWITPRLNLTYVPRAYFVDEDSNLVRRNVKFRLSTGLYYQPPLYRTMRYLDGTIHPDVVSQKSWHNVIGTDVYFKIWDREFKFIAEAYYKYMWDVVPYEIDNVRIRYYAENNAVAYAYGVDAKINGQFVNGVESFFRIGFLKTMENIENDDYYHYINSDGDTILPGYTFNQTIVDSIHIEPGWIPRPTDQTLTFTLFFQDKMPKYENFKVSANLNFGTPLPYGPPSYERYKDVLRTKSYFRLDLGFMYDFIHPDSKKSHPESKFYKTFDQFTLSLDAFNLLAIKNIVSYQWLQDIAGRYYAIPNHLTGRRLNLRLLITF